MFWSVNKAQGTETKRKSKEEKRVLSKAEEMRAKGR